MPIHCRECGRSNQDDREFCFSCGAFLEWAGQRVDRGEPEIVPVPPGRTAEAPRETIRRLSLALSPLNISVLPGERRSILVTVGNLGSTVEGSELRLTGLPAEWWTFDPPRVSLLPSTEARATLNIHPPRSTTSKSGDYPVAVDVSTQLDRKASAEAIVTVEPFVQLSSQLTPENSRGRSRATHHIRLANESNVRVAARVEAVDKDEALRFQPQATDLMVEAGDSVAAALKVRARRWQWLRRKPPQRFIVRASAPGVAPIDRPASFTQLPLLPGWAVPVAAIAAVALIVGVVVLGHKSGTSTTRLQQARAASQASTTTSPSSHVPIPTRPAARPSLAPVTTLPHAATGAAPSAQPVQAAPTPAAAKNNPATTSTTTPSATKLHGVVRWPDKSLAAGVNIVIYPHGYTTSDPSHLPQANVATTAGGIYATRICTKTPCDRVQAFLALPVNTVFPDGCTLPLTTSTGPLSGFATSGGTVDWMITDGTCTADPSGKPIDDPNVPAFTTEYVEQRINTVGGGTISNGNSPVTTTTTSVP
jgi:hypothetical protein